MTTSTDYTSPEARALTAGSVTVSVVDDQLGRFHVTIPRRETSAERMDAIIRHALAARYTARRPSRS